METLGSGLGVALVGLGMWGPPCYFFYQKKVHFLYALLSGIGLYTFFIQLSPFPFPLYGWVPLVWALQYGMLKGLQRSWASSSPMLPLRVHGGLFIFCLLPMCFSWQPPGDDPVKWASLARLIVEHSSLPPTAMPISEVSLNGVSMGTPSVIALFQAVGVGGARSTFFVECVSLFLFVALLFELFALLLKRKIAILVGCLVLGLFRSPMDYLNWGGTPTLLGMSGGLGFFHLMSQLSGKQLRFSWAPCLLAALMLSAGFYTHPVGFFISTLFFGVLFLFSSLRREVPLGVWGATVGTIGLGVGALIAPYLLGLHQMPSPFELDQVTAWQMAMSPHLWNEKWWVPYRIYRQWTSYLGEPALLAAIASGIALLISPTYRRFGLSLALMFVGISFMMCHGYLPGLPLHYLLYPERVATLALFPLGLMVGKSLEALYILDPTRLRYRLFLLLLIAFVPRQVMKWGWQDWKSRSLDQEDLKRMEQISLKVPPEDCIDIGTNRWAQWIAPLALRCTIPFHGMSMHLLEEQERSPRPAKWSMVDLHQAQGPRNWALTRKELP